MPLDTEAGADILPGTVQVWYSPLTINPPDVLLVEGTLYIRSLAA